MKPKINSVDEYIAAQPESARPVLERVRDAIRKSIPAAEETISYKIPAYRLKGKTTKGEITKGEITKGEITKGEITKGETILYFAGWKKHYSLYPITAPVIAAFDEELAPYEVNNKGTLRLPLSEPVPVQLIGRIAKFRANEVGAEKKNVEKGKIKKKRSISKRR